MNNDLISRSELKKALKSNCKPELCHDYNTSWCERCCRTNDFEDLIDEAPTVELTEEQAIDKLHETGWLIRHDKEMTERPQGEHVIKCPDCRFYHKKWHSDKRMKEKGYWCCWCDCHDVWVGGTNGFCSLAERQGEEE